MNIQFTQTNKILLIEVYMTCLLKSSKSFPPVLAIYIYRQMATTPLKNFQKLLC